MAFWNLRDKYNKNIAKKSELITSKGGTGVRFSFSTVVTPECSQEFTQTPTGLSSLVSFMIAHVANNPDFDSNRETDNETTMSSSEDETSDEEISQPLTPKTDFQKEVGRPTNKKNNPNPMSLEELRTAYNNVDSISELSQFLCKRVEQHERVNGSFKDKGEMYAWVRRNIKLLLCTSNLLLQG